MGQVGSVSVTVDATIERPRPELFDYFIPVALERIFHRYGPIPAVVSTSDQSGPWDQPGSSRTVHLGDGSTAGEQVTDVVRPEYFSYRVGEFTNFARHLATEARGEWSFHEIGPSTTLVEWTYAFVARSLPAQLLLTPVIRIAWRGYMQSAMDSFARLAEREIPLRTA